MEDTIRAVGSLDINDNGVVEIEITASHKDISEAHKIIQDIRSDNKVIELLKKLIAI